MMRPALSAVASSLIRVLIARAGATREAVLLTDYRSTDWQSLTFCGERHEIGLRVTGSDPKAVVDRLLDRLEDAEFMIAGQIVADIAVCRTPVGDDDGTIGINLDVLTIAE